MNIPQKWIWYRDFMLVLLHKELTVRYKGSLLGFMWSILNPLAQAYIFFIVFGVYMRFNVPHYIVALLAAMFPWQWFCNCVNEAPFTFLANPTLVKKVAFPRGAIPLVMNLQNMVHFCLSLPIYMLFMLWEGLYPGWIWLWGVPLLMLLTLASIYGLCLLFGSLNLFFKDIGNLVAIVMQVAFFGTPIMYVLSVVPQEYYWCFKVNPVAPLFISWRYLLMDNAIHVEWLLPAAGYACLSLTVGLLTYRTLNRRFAEVM